MKILYAASEAAPFAKSGGLADVAGALPKALVRDGIDARVVMPLYGDLKFKDTLTYVTNFSVPVGWRSQYCGLFKAERDGVVFYFIDNEYYFKRSGLYGFYDDGERFAFFSRAILEMLFYTDFEPDIINCNDWQTALTPVYLNLYYRHLDKFSRIKTVFTIHNIAYQGKYGLDILEDTCGIGARDAHVVEYDGCANFMKGAIECADKVTTVSPTYAQEILDPWFSHGLDGLLRQKQYKLCGILNGIDVDVFNPATDPDIAKNYDAETFQEGKAVCKEALQDEFGLHKDGSPVMAMVTRLVGHKGVDLVQAIAEGLLQQGIELVILGSGEAQYENFFNELCARNPGRVGVLRSQAETTAVHRHVVKGRAFQCSHHIQEQRLTQGAGLLGSIQHRNVLHRLRQGSQQMLGAEGAIQVHLDHAHFFAARVQKIYGFLNGVAHRTHSHNHTVCVRRAVVVEQLVVPPRQVADGLHVFLHDGGQAVIGAVAGLPVLEEGVRVLDGVADRGMLAVQGPGLEAADGVPVHQAAHVVVVQHLDLLDLMGGSEALEEVLEGDAALDGGEMGHGAQVHALLHAG